MIQCKCFKFGAYLSSFTIVIIGHLAYFFGIFLLLEGTKITLGINSKSFFLRALSNILGIFFLDIFLLNYGLEILRQGLISVFLSEVIRNLILLISSNSLMIYLINLLFFILGILLIFLSYSLRIVYFSKLLNESITFNIFIL